MTKNEMCTITEAAERLLHMPECTSIHPFSNEQRSCLICTSQDYQLLKGILRTHVEKRYTFNGVTCTRDWMVNVECFVSDDVNIYLPKDSTDRLEWKLDFLHIIECLKLFYKKIKYSDLVEEE